MLRPDERSHLLELLRPPSGCRLDHAVGTTFSLDLMSALMVPLSFAFFDWEKPDGSPTADPLAMLEALRRYGDRFTVFCQAGQIRLPPKYPPLVTFLEPSLYEVLPPDSRGVFHPKVWVMRFISEEDAVFYRVLCLSRNLTFDRCWDTVVALDGELTDWTKNFAVNHPLADFIEALPGLVLKKMPLERRKGIRAMADELRRVRFSWPDGFDGDACRFWVGGLEGDGRKATLFEGQRDQSLIVSPFLSNGVLQEFIEAGSALHLISRLESLQEIPEETLQSCKSVHFLAPQTSGESDEDQSAPALDEVLTGLHAKLFVIDRGWNASVFSGSFNATFHALKHNVEFMVEMVGKRKTFGVEQFLQSGKDETYFSDLLRAYDPSIESAPLDMGQRELDDMIQAVKMEIINGRPKLLIQHSTEFGVFDMNLQWLCPSQWPRDGFEVRVWPVTQHQDRGQALSKSLFFTRLSHLGLTPLIAFEISASKGEHKGKLAFVMNLPIEGMPEDRYDRILSSLISGKAELFRLILFLLSSGEEGLTSSGEGVAILSGLAGGEAGSSNPQCLFESLVRVLHRSPERLEHVASLIESLKKTASTEGSSALLDPDFQKIWDPIWEAFGKGKAA